MSRTPSPLAADPLSDLVVPDRGQEAIAIHLLDKAALEGWLAGAKPGQRAQIAAQKFTAAPNTHAIIADGEGWLVVAGVADVAGLSSWCLGKLGEALPAGSYRLAPGPDGKAIKPDKALLGWVLGQYAFERYRSDASGEGPRVLATGAVKAIAPALAEAGAVALVRDLVNTPAEDMGPGEMEHTVEMLARPHRATVHITKGEALEREFPMVHMVGRAAGRAHAPRMIELEWGDPAHPRLAIIGKGVSFDSGGLDLKPSSAMLLMKKDMGGAAHAIALAGLIMHAGCICWCRRRKTRSGATPSAPAMC